MRAAIDWLFVATHGVWIPLLVGIATWFLTGVLRHYAIAHRLLDVPNARSSHHVSTPRGGGAAIVLATSLALAWLSWSGGLGMPVGVLVASVLVATVGFVDDHRPLPATVRLVGHFTAAALAVASLGGAPPLTLSGHVVTLGPAGDVVAALFVVWLLNLTNVKDGIDGITGSQVLTVCAVGAALYFLVAPGSGRWREPAVLAGAAAGFLVWNWPPARIFMGDVGSGYIGFLVAVLSLRAASVAPALGWSWLILSGVFIVDATTTLLRRAARGERLFEAHRSHAYQHLALAWGSHRAVTLVVVGINTIWLAPLALLVATQWLDGFVGLVLAYLPLTIGVVRLGAGAAQPSRETGHAP
jgi:Fuc2NAc and GlcNAc transferase